MADLRAEQIMSAILSNITGLTSTGQNVARGRVYNHETSKLPALTLIQGPDDIINGSFSNLSFIDSELQVIVRASAMQTQAIETQLNQIRKEVHIALMTNVKQGLSFVVNTKPIGSSEPEFKKEGQQPYGFMDIAFLIHYRHSVTDASI